MCKWQGGGHLQRPRRCFHPAATADSARNGSGNTPTLTPECPPPIAGPAPTAPELTDYDRSHIVTYLRILDAADEGAPWDEVARIVLGLDTEADAAAARAIFDSHLARARWISAHGYRDLLRTGR